MFPIFIVKFFFLFGQVGANEFRESRILLTDPSFLLSQIQVLESKIQHLTTAFQDQQVLIKDQQLTIKDLQSKMTLQSGGAVYIRWGRTSCPVNTSETVYSGYMGGSNSLSEGGAADPVCLTDHPVLESTGGEGQYILGAEYGSNAFGPSVMRNDVPCAVCRSRADRSVVMIPGTNKCTSGWNLQFQGHLAAGHDNFKSATQFICIDKSPESLVGGEADVSDGRKLFAVRAKCGSLKCPPYHNQTELTCVVCTK